MGSIFVTIAIALILASLGKKMSGKVVADADEVDTNAESLAEEFVSDEDCLVDESQVKSAAEVETDAAVEAVEGEDQFDLRQAVIYQTILQNDYTGIR